MEIIITNESIFKYIRTNKDKIPNYDFNLSFHIRDLWFREENEKELILDSTRLGIPKILYRISKIKEEGLDQYIDLIYSIKERRSFIKIQDLKFVLDYWIENVFNDLDISGISWSTFNKSDLELFKQGFFWGLKDNNGEVVLTPKYELISEFFDGKATICYKGLYGVIDDKGKVIIEPTYERKEFIFINNTSIFILNSKRGVIDSSGKVIIKPLYDNLLRNGSYFISYNKSYKGFGLISNEGKIILNNDFAKITGITSNCLIVEKDKLSRIFYITANKSKFQVKQSPYYNKIEQLNKFILLCYKSENTFDLRQVDLELISTDCLEYSIISGKFIDVTLKTNNHILLRIDGTTLLTSEYSYINTVYLNNEVISFILKYRVLYNIFSVQKNSNLLSKNVDQITFLKIRDGFYLIQDRQLFGIINSIGEFIIPLFYDAIETLNNNRYNTFKDLLDIFKVKKNNKWGVVNPENKLVVSIVFEEIFFNYNLIVGKRNKQFEVYNINGQLLFINICEDLKFLGTNTFLYKKDGDYGIIDFSGKEIVPCIYDEITTNSFFSEFTVRYGNKVGVVSRKGEVLSDLSVIKK